MANSSFYGNNPTPTEYRDIDELIADAEEAAQVAQAAGAGASSSATAAANSASQAANSAAASATSASQSNTYAVSANTSKNDAQAAATAAQTSATNSATSATNSAASASAAQTSATNAATSASGAANSASTATTKANEAASSASAAATSATNSATSATASANSATNAATSATTATTKASEAATSATSASISAANASTSASAAAGSANQANTSATNAASSATSASGSATTATTKASEAATSATNAAASAATATTKASEASASATNAASSASAASTSASNAATSATNAANSATAASGSASSASTYATSAATSATNAANSATNSANSATSASNSATAAANAQTAAESARDQALTAYDNFDDRYLGPKASDPTTDNDGNPLVGGTLYFNTTIGGMKLYDGTAWVAAYISGAGVLQVANNLSDLSNVATARTNLGLGSAATQPSTAFAAASHTHPASQISDSTTAGRLLLTAADAAAQRTALGLGSAALSATSDFAAASHTHTIDNVTGLQTALDGKAPLTGTGTSGTWPISITGNAATVSSITSSQVTTALGYTPANVSGANATGTWPISINGDNNKTAPRLGYAASGLNTNTGGAVGPMVDGQGGGGAGISFHRPGAYGLNLGLDSDNVFRIGGWSASAERLWLNMSGDLGTPGSMRSPIFYDSNNTGYYVNPDGASNVWQIYANDWFRANGNTGLYSQTHSNHFYSNGSYWVAAGNGSRGNGGIQFNGGYESSTKGYLYWDGAGFGFLNSSGNWQYRIEYGNANSELYNVTWANDIRPYIMYDRNDTNWYCDPNSRSRFVAVDFGAWQDHRSDYDYWRRLRFDGGSTTYIAGGTTGQWYIQFQTANDNATRSILEGGGNFYTNGNVTAYWSDRRLKTHIHKIENWREIIGGLNGYYYEWNDLGKKVLDGAAEDGINVGLVAQEVKAVLPQAAAIQMLQYKDKKDGVLIPKDDINYDPENPYLTVREEKLIPVLVEAIKGLMAEVEELKAKLENK